MPSGDVECAFVVSFGVCSGRRSARAASRQQLGPSSRKRAVWRGRIILTPTASTPSTTPDAHYPAQRPSVRRGSRGHSAHGPAKPGQALLPARPQKVLKSKNSKKLRNHGKDRTTAKCWYCFGPSFVWIVEHLTRTKATASRHLLPWSTGDGADD